MILRRFIQHTKEQNWYAVGLDVIVVIVGIFLGMQVTEWNENRVKRNLELEILRDLSSELSQYQEWIEIAGKKYDSSRQAIDTMLSAIHSDESISEEEVNQLAIRIRQYYRLADGTSTLQFLISDERFDFISDKDLKMAISDIASLLTLVNQFEDEETNYLNQDYNPFIAKYVDQYDAKSSEMWLNDTVKSKFDTDIDELLNSREFSNILVQRRNKLELVDHFRFSVERSIETALQLIRNKLKG